MEDSNINKANNQIDNQSNLDKEKTSEELLKELNTISDKIINGEEKTSIELLKELNDKTNEIIDNINEATKLATPTIIDKIKNTVNVLNIDYFETKLKENEKKIYLKLLDKNIDFFISFEKGYKELVVDNEIKLNFLNNIFDLLKNLYEILYKLNIKDSETYIKLFKFTLEFFINDTIILNELDIQLKEKRNEIKDNLNNIIDKSSDLLILRKTLKNGKKLFNCLKKTIM
jgi:hypothetical protein